MTTPIHCDTLQLIHYSQQWGVDPELPALHAGLAALTPLPTTPPLTMTPSMPHNNGPLLDAPKVQEDTTLQLEKLLAKLMLESNEQQLIVTKERIESQQSEIHLRHQEQMGKLQASLDEAAKAETSSLITRIFSWVFTALSVVTAAAACVATGGVAVPAVVGAVIAVGMLALSESGATEALTEALSDSIKESFGCDSNKANIGAQVVLTSLILVLSVGTMIGGGLGGAATMANRAISTSAQIANTVQRVASITNGTLAVAGTATQGYGTVKRYESALLQADATEISKLLGILQLTLE
ncbi:MAG: type III secretion system translocon subunit SctE, partial [Kiritimatiellae bacterium]|nr:type III secretion system translocon subunit SctE [Kiritimatiellia bacterium]